MVGADVIAGGVAGILCDPNGPATWRDGNLEGVAMSSIRCLGDANGPVTGGGTGSSKVGNDLAAEVVFGLLAFLGSSSSESSSEKKRGVALFKNECHNLKNKLPHIV